MPRIRTIKPEFCTSEQVGECSTTARLLFVEMWCFCDDAGRHARSPLRLKAECFPFDAFSKDDMEGFIQELLKSKLLVEYEFEGEWYLQVSGWKHQKIDKKTFKFPPFIDGNPAKGPADIRPLLPESSTTTSREVVEGSPPEGSLEESTGEESTGEESTSLSSTLVDAWNEKARSLKSEGYSYSEVAKLTDARKKKLRSRLKDPDFADAFLKGVQMLPIKQWADWVPDFDWMIANDSNVVSLVEGKYHKKTYTQGDRNASIIDEWEPGELTKEIFGDGQDKDTPAIDADSVRRIPARTDA